MVPWKNAICWGKYVNDYSCNSEKGIYTYTILFEYKTIIIGPFGINDENASMLEYNIRPLDTQFEFGEVNSYKVLDNGILFYFNNDTFKVIEATLSFEYMYDEYCDENDPLSYTADVSMVKAHVSILDAINSKNQRRLCVGKTRKGHKCKQACAFDCWNGMCGAHCKFATGPCQRHKNSN